MTSKSATCAFCDQDSRVRLRGDGPLACRECSLIITLEEPWLCLAFECGTPIVARSSPLYCSDYCRQTAKHVRYERRARRDGRILQSDVQEAIQIRRAWVAGGDAYVRRLSTALRQQVFETKGRACLMCHEPATDIDHIQGTGGDEIENLQPLCAACHRTKSIRDLVRVDLNDPDRETVQTRLSMYDERVSAAAPLSICDDDERWDSVWRDLAKARTAIQRKN